jgi:RimJ/RimL family protein N-acetyltransferase
VLEKVGFTHEGTHRDEAFEDGEHVDVLYWGLLAEECGR